MEGKVCVWAKVGYDVWLSACGSTIEGDPTKDGFNGCPFCKRVILTDE